MSLCCAAHERVVFLICREGALRPARVMSAGLIVREIIITCCYLQGPGRSAFEQSLRASLTGDANWIRIKKRKKKTTNKMSDATINK